MHLNTVHPSLPKQRREEKRREERERKRAL